MARDCTEKKNWSRVKCNNCGEMGHTVKKCSQPIKQDTYGGGGGWETNDAAPAQTGASWDNDDTKPTGDWEGGGDGEATEANDANEATGGQGWQDDAPAPATQW